MALTRYLRNFFFGPDGPTGSKFSKQNKPTKQRFKELFESIGFIKETDDRAKTTEQGFAHLATDAEALASAPVNPATQTQSKVTEPHQLPEVGASAPALGVLQSTDAGKRITIKKYRKNMLFSRFRSFFKVENTLGLRSANANLTVTDPDPLDQNKILLTVNVTTGPTGPTGPQGNNALGITSTKGGNITVYANALGVVPPAQYVTAYTDLQVLDGQMPIDLSTAVVTVSPASVPGVFEHSNAIVPPIGIYWRVKVDALDASFTHGTLLVNIDVYGDGTLIKVFSVGVIKLNAGSNGTGLEWIGEDTSHPAATNKQWYTNTLNHTSYWFDDPDEDGVGTWRVLAPGGALEGPTQTHTIVAAGLTQNITATSAPIHIIRGSVTLTGAVNFTHSGSFADGQKFKFIFLSEIDTDGNEFNVFGTRMYPSELKNGPSQISNSNTIVTATWDATAGDFIVIVNNRPMNKEWQSLNGFAHYSLDSLRPKLRIEGNRFYLQGLVVIPLSDGSGGVVTFNNEKTYAQTLQVSPFINAVQGDGGVVLQEIDQRLIFNEGEPVIPDDSYYPDRIYHQQVVMFRRVRTNDPDTYITYTSFVKVEINTSGQLVIRTVRETEYPTSIDVGANDLPGNCMLRFITSRANKWDYVYDFRNTSHGTLHGTHGLVSGDDSGLDPDVDPTITHPMDIDAAAATDIGGFFFYLDISGFIDKP